MSLPTNIAFSGSGPIDHWKGQLTANLGEQNVFLGDISLIPEAKHLKASVNLKSNFYGELKPFFAKILEQECATNANFDIDFNSIKLKDAHIQSPVFDFSFVGNADILPSSLMGDGKVNLTFLKPYAFFSLNGAPYPTKTTSTADCTFKGNWQNLDVNIDGEVKSDPLTFPGFGLVKDIALGLQTELHLKDFLTENLEIEIDTDLDFLGFNTQNKSFIDPQKLVLKMEALYKEQNEKFEISNLNIQGDHLVLHGAIDFEKEDITSCSIDIQHQDLSRFESLMGPVQGTFNATISKEKESPHFHMITQSNDMVIKNYKLPEIMSELNVSLDSQKTKGDFFVNVGIEKPLNISSQFDYAKDILKLQNLSLGGVESKLLGQLSWDIVKNNLQGFIKGNLKEIDFLEPFLHVESLVGNIDCDFKFDTDKKGNAQAQGLVKLKNVHASVDTIFEIGHGLVRLDLNDFFKKPQGKLNISLLDCRAHDVDLSQARLQLEGDFDGAHLTSKFKGAKPFPYELDLIGHYDKKQDGFLFQLSKFEGNLNKKNYALTKPLILTQHKNNFSFPQTSFRIGKGVLAGFLNINFADSIQENSKIQFSWRDLPADLIALITTSIPLQGGIHGHLMLEKKQKEILGHFDIESDQLLFDLGEDFAPVFYTKLSGKINDNTLLLEGSLKEEKLKDSDFTLKGKIPLLFHESFLPMFDEKLPINIDCAGKLDLAYLSPFLPTYEDILEGTIQGSLKLAGLISDPNATGKISLLKGYYENAQFGTILDDIRCDIVAKNSELLLDNLSAIDQKKGEMKGKGKISLKDSFPYNFNVVFNDYQIVNNDDADVKAFANLVFSGQKNQKSNLSGNVDINRAKIKIPEKIHQGVDDFFEEDDYCAENQSHNASMLNLDLKVDLKNPLILSGFGLESEWLGACRVNGDVFKPRIKGALKVQKGDFSLFGTKFALTKGNVYFDGSDKLMPDLYILTESKSSDLIAKLNITGSVDAPKIELTSSPELPQEEIVSRLLFKHGTANLNPMQALKLGTMLNKINGKKLPLFEQFEKIQNILGLDTFELDTSDEDGKGPSPILKAGSKITDKIKVSVEEDLKNRKTHGKLQVELTPHINLETGVSNDLQGNVGVFGKWDY
ncbi:MAG: translocation/assembly module TamB domain-containing protein [Alphaproteobacteria bacterium]|nr:translocation/assembly module TamB domain-containing protein [Alphaproteobacteria bacterium]